MESKTGFFLLALIFVALILVLIFALREKEISARPSITIPERLIPSLQTEQKIPSDVYVNPPVKAPEIETSPIHREQIPEQPIVQTGPPQISECQAITSSGTFELNADIQATTTPCISIENTSNVHINCNGHSISASNPETGFAGQALAITNVNDFSIENCQLWPGSRTFPTMIAKISNSQNGYITQNTMKNYFYADHFLVQNSSNLHITKNTFYSLYQQQDSNNNKIEENTFQAIFYPGDEFGSCLIIDNFGTNNLISGNTIDGASNGVFAQRLGYDDGICTTDAENDIITGNTIKNTWDCGIESSGNLFNSQITSNTLTNTGPCGIGGWYWSSLKGNTISYNTIDTSEHMFQFYRAYGLRPKDTYYYFQDNSFIGNKFTNPSVASGTSSTFIIPYGGLSVQGRPDERDITPADVKASNNIFAENDFTTILFAPHFIIMPQDQNIPAGLIVDGGGNICGQKVFPPTNYPLAC